MNPGSFLLNIAHRGARSLAPENTLAAARLGLEAGADLWELDVAMTSDDQLFLVHDDTLERTSNASQVFPDRAPWANHTFTLAEVRRLDFGTWFADNDPFGQIAGGAVSKSQVETYRGLQAPTLQEALEFTRASGWRVNIEIKDQTGLPADSLITGRVLALVQALAMEEHVIISSFNHQYLRQVRQASAKIATAALVDTPHPDPLALLHDLDAQAYNPGIEHLDWEQIDQVREAGYGVNVWTVNDELVMHRLIEAHVTGIFTDFPQLLTPILQNLRGR